MTVTAVDAVACDMSLVTELNRLLAYDLRPGHPGRSVDLRDQNQQAGDDEDGAEDADA